MKSAILFCFAALMPSAALPAAEPALQALPFSPDVISRLSLDGKPRSLAIRQRADVWLGYDLERATLLKAWQAPAGKPGLVKSGFTTRSTGTSWFEDASDAAWELRRGETIVPLSIRYVGCSHRNDHVELRWELKHDAGTLRLFERVFLTAATAAVRATDRVVRELRVETLSADEALLPPSTVRKAWRVTVNPNSAGQTTAGPNTAATGLRGKQWHRMTLP
jgi:hypothetical protein